MPCEWGATVTVTVTKTALLLGPGYGVLPLLRGLVLVEPRGPRTMIQKSTGLAGLSDIDSVRATLAGTALVRILGG